MSRIVISGIVILSLCGPMASGFAAESVAETFQKALVEEEANQNLEAAIKAYQNVIAQLDEQRRMRATAIFRLGECYRKLGQTNEAAAQYQRILAEFKDQATLTGLSSQNLRALGMLSGSGSQTNLTAEVSEKEDPEIAGLRRLLQTSPDLINAVEQDETPLHRAASAGKTSVVQFLLKNDARVDVRTKSGITPLHSAVRNGSLSIVDMLVRAGMSVNATDSEGQTALHWAAELGRNAIADFLIRNGADVNVQSGPSGKTPLMLAAAKGFRAVGETLLRAGADVNVNAQLSGVGTALHEAAVAGQAEFMDFLMSNGANPDVINNQGLTPLHAATGAEQESSIRSLLRHHVKVDYPVARYVQVGPEIRPSNSATPHLRITAGSTALHIAVKTNNRRIVELLLENGANVHAQAEGDKTALAVAVSPNEFTRSHTDIEIVKLLLRKGADANLYPKDNWSPLVTAIRYGTLEMAQLLIENKASVDAPSAGARPISFAIGSERPDFLSLLLKSGANPNFRTDRGTTPLHDAVESRNKQAAAILLEHGADVNAVNDQGETPIERLRDILMPQPLQDFPSQSPGQSVQQSGRQIPGWNNINSAAMERAQVSSEIARMLQRGGAEVPGIAVGTEDRLWIAFAQPALVGSLTSTPLEALTAVMSRLRTAPNLSSLKLHKKGVTEPIALDLAKALETHDCNTGPRLNRGDVLEVESDATTALLWPQLPARLADQWQKCLSRTITIDIDGEKTTVKCSPVVEVANGNSNPSGKQLSWNPSLTCALEYVVKPVVDKFLQEKKLSRHDLDLTKIIVIRVFNEGKANAHIGLPLTSNFILCDGDEIQIRKVLNSQPNSNEGGKALFTGQVKGSEVVWAANEMKTLFEALVEVGYHMPGAKLSSVQLDRIDPVTKESRVIVVDVQKIIKGDRSEDIVLQPGDRIHVPMVTFPNP